MMAKGIIWKKQHGVSMRTRAGFTLVETMLAFSISVMLIAAIVVGFIQAATEGEWSAHNLAANSLAMQKIEQVRSTRWDLWAGTSTDQVVQVNFPADSQLLDIPYSNTNKTWATNYTIITIISNNPPYKMIQVNCVWQFKGRKWYTNTMSTYRSPDQ